MITDQKLEINFKLLTQTVMVFVNFLTWLPKTSCMKRKIMAVAICIVLFASYQGMAQSMADVKSQMEKDWVRAKAYTIDYLNTMPADKYSFKATDSVRSFAQQMLHISAANAFFASNVTDQPLPAGITFTLEQRPTAQTKDSVMYYITTSYDYALNAVKNSDISKWGEKKKLFGRFEETKFAILNKAFEHQSHHRGQTTVYIRLQGIKPPEERLF
jgi:uncharacterized damage-inducible protein DinB